MFMNKKENESTKKIPTQKGDLELKIVEAKAKIQILEEKYNALDCRKLEKKLLETKLKTHSLKWQKIKQQLAATLEEKKTEQIDTNLRQFVTTYKEFSSIADESTVRLKSDIMAKKGKQKILMLGGETFELRQKLQETTESKDKINLKICQMETNHNILQNRNAAMLIRLRKNLHEVECKRRDIKEKTQHFKNALK